MSRRWFWYPHDDLQEYIDALDPPLSELCVRLPNARSAIRIQTDEPELLTLLRSNRYERYAVDPQLSDASLPRLTYLHTTKAAVHPTVLTADHLMRGSRDRTDVAFVAESSHVLLHLPENSYASTTAGDGTAEPVNLLRAYSSGIVKSLVNGLISYSSPDAVGCHGAVLRIGDQGVAIVGATGAGKSTHALRFLLADGSSVLLTDDWSILRRDEGAFVATSLERQFFARRAQVQTLRAHFGQATDGERLGLVEDHDQARLDLDLEAILGSDRFIESTAVDLVIRLTRVSAAVAGFRPLAEEEFIEAVISDSPHIPFHSASPSHLEAIRRFSGARLHDVMVARLTREASLWRALHRTLPVFSLSYSERDPESTVHALIKETIAVAGSQRGTASQADSR